MYQDAILANRFLQERDDNFYNKYLEELKTQRFVKNDVIAKTGNKAECVYFIMHGVVHNQTTDRYLEGGGDGTKEGRYYDGAGQMINHDAIFEKTLIMQDCVAETDVSMLKYERETFELIIGQFPDIYEDLK